MSALIQPDWPVAANVSSLITTQYSPEPNSQISQSPYGQFNLGTHVGDDQEHVEKNRQLLVDYAGLPAMPQWHEQVHGAQVQVLGKTNYKQADACYTNAANQVCAIMTADCLPILLADESGQEVAAVHAGWRGLLAGVIENTLAHFESRRVLAYLGPAISQINYQVSEEVYQAFQQYNQNTSRAFIEDGHLKYKMDIVALARLRLQDAKVIDVYGGDYCTYAEERFYSYRRASHQADGKTGRMASMIWMQNKGSG